MRGTRLSAGRDRDERNATPLVRPDTQDQGAVVQARGRNQARNEYAIFRPSLAPGAAMPSEPAPAATLNGRLREQL
jgi:hypothetical protein